jgi:two-component system KDP operon response regulator KdpE
MTEASKLMIVDDEPALRRALRTSLTASGFEVLEACKGEEALTLLARTPVDLVLLDINMPGISGVEVCRRIRDISGQMGIIMVTVRDSEDDKVQALEAGADDYIAKPYRLRELVARLRAMQRRLQANPHADETVYRAGSLEIDLRRRLVSKDGIEVHLSPKEFDLLSYLIAHQGAPVMHTRLLRAVWGPEFGGEVEYLRTYMKMLRKKLEADPAHPEYLLTEPWVGYRFQNPSEAKSDPDNE